jgi:hypothetical protein
MPQFMMLLYDTPAMQQAWAGFSPEEMEAGIQLYAAWSEGLAARGKLRGGDKLRDREGRVVRGAGDEQRVTDGPFAEAKEVLGGFFVIEADDYEEALELTRDCPHLEFGGTVEIRAVDEAAREGGG